MVNKTKWLLGGIILSLLLVGLLLFLIRATILDACGIFMAPDGNYVADVAILEGSEFLDRGVVQSGIKLILSQKVKRIVVILHLITPFHRPFGLNEDYPNLVKKELETLGLKETDIKIIVNHIHDPITLTSAKGALEALSQDHVRSAILLSKGFHTRRSFLVYQHVGIPLQIKIFPSACFNEYQLDHWWSNEKAVRDFTSEVVKLAYYFIRNYIPLKLSY
ncbi:MAG: hypothetical protein HPY65_18310 [Syntrophaceae bacterium]|nr:hypothetical protein [Syntrophaceae bacterium]